MNHTNQTYQRGDVVLLLFPNSDLRSAKRRPALIIQADHLQTGLPQVIVAMISSQISRMNHPAGFLSIIPPGSAYKPVS